MGKIDLFKKSEKKENVRKKESKIISFFCLVIAFNLILSINTISTYSAAKNSKIQTKAEIKPVPIQKSFSKDKKGNLPLIKIINYQFTVNGKPFKFIGTNAPNIVWYDEDDPNMPKADLENVISSAKATGITVIRLFINWDKTEAEEFDRILDLARKYGVYIMPAFDLLDDKKLSYNQFNNKDCISEFKKVLKDKINRVNSINGIAYKDDTTIFAWDVGNEPNFSRLTKSGFNSWLNEITTYVKSLDKIHLITLGQTYCKFKDSPMDQIFEDGYMDAFKVPNLDFMSYHYYQPENSVNPWNDPAKFRFIGYDETKSDIAFLSKEYAKVGKPLVLQEFGFTGDKKFLDWTKLDLAEEIVTRNCIDGFKGCFDGAFSNGVAGAMFFAWGDIMEKDYDSWTLSLNHNAGEKELCDMILNYKVP